MTNKRSTLAVAIGSIFAASTVGYSLPSLADTTFDFKSSSSVSAQGYALEIPDGENLQAEANGDFLIILPVVNKYVAKPPTIPAFYKVALTGGAQFVNSHLSCTMTTVSGTAGTIATGTVDAVKQLGNTALDDTITFNLIPTDVKTATLLNSGGCNLTFDAIQIDTKTAVRFSGVLEYVTLGTNKTLVSKGTIISFKQGLQANSSPLGTNVIIDVTTGSKFFTDDTILSTQTAYLGEVSFGAISPDTFGASGTSITTTAAASTFNLSIKGPLLQSTIGSGDGGVYLASADDCATIITNGDLAVMNTATQMITFTDLSAEDVSAGVAVCFVGNGNSIMEEGQISATLSGTPNTDWSLFFLSDVLLLTTVDKNGSSLKLLNIPNPTIQTDALRIRFYNMGSQAGAVYGTMYDMDTGTVLGTPNVQIATLTAGGDAFLTEDDLATLFGVASWPKRSWMQVDAEISTLAAQLLIRAQDGTLTNMSAGGVRQNLNN